ncbi:multiple sugar transport system substrate-binding protein [Nonomuraea solani]|uniref:Multiple sugar transport system substrate-binding protein n=1 Tax=Nonomuraea solani TaxID=1144553 RepID=A0A1H6EI20_9ACTN|nr:ABC transporter substrate-binding protein [Nonomuraea solani]SEG96596.1 multiple sugar transport system substrate-binding protein [Nonomuraea solani]
MKIAQLGMPLVLMAALTACSGDAAESDGKTTITFSYLWSGPEGEAIEKLIAGFNGSQDKIVVKGVSSPDTQKQLASMSSANGTFDISDHFGNTVGSWAAKGILAPLDDLLEQQGVDTAAFAPAAMDQMRHKGRTYALPIAVHTFQLVYNKKLLDAAGVEPPTTMDELAAAIPKLTETDGKGAITRLGLGNADLPTSLTTLGYAFGGAWDGTGPTPGDPGNLAALKFWQDNITNKYGADKVSAFKAGWGQYMSAQDPFYTGRVAMVIDGEWQAVSIPKNAPGLEWGVSPIPVARPDLDGTTQLTASTLFIPANSKHRQEAAAFMKYLVSESAARELSLALGNLPARTGLADDPAYAKIPNFGSWLKAMKSPKVRSLSSAPYAAEYAADLASAFDSVVRATATPEEAMAKVAGRAAGYAKG